MCKSESDEVFVFRFGPAGREEQGFLEVEHISMSINA